MARKSKNNGNLDKMWSVPVTGDMLRHIKKKGIKPEHVREFFRNYGKDKKDMPQIGSWDWRRLRDLLDRNPAIQLVGQINAGKTHLVKSLVATGAACSCVLIYSSFLFETISVFLFLKNHIMPPSVA